MRGAILARCTNEEKVRLKVERKGEVIFEKEGYLLYANIAERSDHEAH